MKKLLLLVTLASATIAYAGYTYGQCQATAKSTGQRCKNGVSNAGDTYCSQHK